MSDSTAGESTAAESTAAEDPQTASPEGQGTGATVRPTEHPAAPPIRRKPRKVFLLIGLVAAGALAIGLFTGVGTRSSSGPPGVGSTAPSFALPRLGAAGQVGTPADGGGSGHPAVVLFFASWCKPCHVEMPALAAAYRQQRQAGGKLSRLAVIGVDVLDPTGDGLAFAHQEGMTFPIGSDSDASVTQGLYDFVGPPEAVFINGDGTIAHIQRGPMSAAQLRSWERKIVGT
jgi:cytochrome c biogenesis protein CcmG/thiol:disulfide interchange protein DsbE